MRTRSYRLTVIGSALAWFMVGLHFPVVHAVTQHGQTPPWGVLAATALLAVAGLAGVWVLLRAPSRASGG